MKPSNLLLGLLGGLVFACSASSSDVGSGADAVTRTKVGKVDEAAITPAYWNVDADPSSPTPGSEPINVIISTNLEFSGPSGIVDALQRTSAPRGELKVNWDEVDIGAGFEFVTGLLEGERRCISAEKATIDDEDNAGQVTSGCLADVEGSCLGTTVEEDSLRLLGCAGVVFDGESHARAWKSSKTRVRQRDGTPLTTYYLALSQEHVCTVDVNGKKTAWHCILPNGFEGTLLGIKGHKVTAKTGGYNQGRDDFVADLKRIAEVYDYEIICRDFTRPTGRGLVVPNVDPVTWDDKVTHCSIIAPNDAVPSP